MITPTTLILDGIWGRPRRFRALRDMIRACIGPAELYPYNCSGLIRFESLGEDLANHIRSLHAPVNLVAFSMGGIVCRAARMLDPNLPIERAVFLNSPHYGSWAAYTLPLPGVKQLRPSSPFMKQLNETDWPIPTLAVWCPGDAVILPGSSARFTQATQTLRCDVPLHPWPVWSPRIRKRIVEFLAAEAAIEN